MARAERWISLPTRVGRAGDDSIFVLSQGSQKMGVMNPAAYRVLQRWDRFRTSDEQASFLLEQGWPRTAAPALATHIDSLTKSGRLLSLSELRKRLTNSYEPALPVDCVAWPTKDRHHDLLRSVNSWFSVLREYGRSADLLVVDDSEKDAEDNREALRGLKAAANAAIDYLGIAEKKHIVEHLNASGLDPRILRFSLFGEGLSAKPYGTNRNWVYLGVLGRRALSVDDDTVCEYCSGHWHRESLRFFPGDNPIRVRFFEWDEELKDVPRFDGDPLRPHELVLGRTPGSVVTDFERAPGGRHSVDLSQVTPELARKLACDQGPVMASTNGVWGDSVLAHRNLILNLDGHLRDELGDHDAYQTARDSTRVLYSSPGFSLVPDSNVFAASFATDYSMPIPPFFPAGRGEDTIWAATIDACFPSGWVAHLPQAVAHRPSIRPESRDDGPFMLTFARILKLLIRSFPQSRYTSDPWGPMRDLGSYLIELSRAEWPELTYFVRTRWLPLMSRSIEQLEALLLIHNRQPGNWAADVDAHIESLHRYAVSEDFAIPVELRSYADGRPRPREEARRLLQDLVRKYGELLMAWPDMVSVAKELKAAERFPLTRLG